MALPLIGLGLTAARLGGAALRAAPGVAKGAGGMITGLYASKGPAAIIGQKLFEYGAVLPAIGIGARALGVPVGLGSAAPPAVMGGMAGGMGMMGGMQLSPGQFDSLYGSQGWSPPWQQQQGLYERMQNRQLGAQRGIVDAQQRTQRYGIQRQSELGFDTNKTALGMAGITAGTQKYLGDRQQQIADFSTQRQLQGLMDSNKTSARIADLSTSRQLNAVYDNNRTTVKVAGIGANRDKYVADRGVEVARWGGSIPRIATFGALMR